jgi:hypothetical protein
MKRYLCKADPFYFASFDQCLAEMQGRLRRSDGAFMLGINSLVSLTVFLTGFPFDIFGSGVSPNSSNFFLRLSESPSHKKRMVRPRLVVLIHGPLQNQFVLSVAEKKQFICPCVSFFLPVNHNIPQVSSFYSCFDVAGHTSNQRRTVFLFRAINPCREIPWCC